MLLQCFELLCTLWRHLTKDAFKLAKLSQAPLQLLQVIVPVLQQRDLVTAEQPGELLDPRLAPQALLPALQTPPIVALHSLDHSDELAVQNRVTCVEVTVLLAQNHHTSKRRL